MSIYTKQKPQASSQAVKSFCAQQFMDFIGFYNHKLLETLPFLQNVGLQFNVDVYYCKIEYFNAKDPTYHAIIAWRKKTRKRPEKEDDYEHEVTEHFLQFEGQKALDILKLRNDFEKVLELKKREKRILPDLAYLEGFV